jgi:hypothetical protein
MLNAPVRTGVEVQQVTRLPGRSGFRVVTSVGHRTGRQLLWILVRR